MKNTIIAAVAASLLSTVSFADSISTWVYKGKDFIGYERLSDDGFTTYNINYSVVDGDYRVVLTSISGQKSRLRHPDFDHVLELAGDSDTAEEFIELTQDLQEELLEELADFLATDVARFSTAFEHADPKAQRLIDAGLADHFADLLDDYAELKDDVANLTFDTHAEYIAIRDSLRYNNYDNDSLNGRYVNLNNRLTSAVQSINAVLANQAAEAEAEFLASPAGQLQTQLLLSIDAQIAAIDAVREIYGYGSAAGSHPVADQLKELIRSTTSLEELEEIRQTHFVDFTDYAIGKINTILVSLVDS